MQTTTQLPSSERDSFVNAGQLLTGLAVLIATLAFMWWGFLLLRNSAELNHFFVAAFAIVWGVAGVGLLYFSLNRMVESFGDRVRTIVQPYIFVGPAVLLLTWFLVLPTIRTAILSFMDSDSTNFVGLSNYAAVFTDSQMLESFRNNVLWMVFGTFFCVSLGLLIAVFADRSKFERIAKAIIFMPMAISFVGAAVIWRFVYFYQAPGQQQIGLLNSIVTGLGGQPQTWIVNQPSNVFFLIVILIWMQTGFAMVIFSSALKGVPDDLLEAGRIDGANERRIFFNIIIPYIQGTIITVTTTILIFTLKIFDVVIAMTGGQYGTEVIATQFYRQFFQNRNFGYGSAIAMVLVLAVIPVMIYNLRQSGKQEAF